MSDIFISYSHIDSELAMGLAKEFKRNGWSVWWDPDIRIGRNYNGEIDQALRAARCVVVAWTQHSVSSDYVQAEASTAQGLGTLVPVLCEDGLALPLEFKMLQAASLVGWLPGSSHESLDLLITRMHAILSDPHARPVTKKPSTLKPLAQRLAATRFWMRCGLHVGVLLIVSALSFMLVTFFGAPKVLISMLPYVYVLYVGVGVALEWYLRTRFK
jgi:hypothetical protein